MKNRIEPSPESIFPNRSFVPGIVNRSGMPADVVSSAFPFRVVSGQKNMSPSTSPEAFQMNAVDSMEPPKMSALDISSPSPPACPSPEEASARAVHRSKRRNKRSLMKMLHANDDRPDAKSDDEASPAPPPPPAAVSASELGLSPPASPHPTVSAHQCPLDIHSANLARAPPSAAELAEPPAADVPSSSSQGEYTITHSLHSPSLSPSPLPLFPTQKVPTARSTAAPGPTYTPPWCSPPPHPHPQTATPTLTPAPTPPSRPRATPPSQHGALRAHPSASPPPR
jgi:hypothetical protein